MERIKLIWPKWEVVEVLGQGGFGTVYKAKRDNFGDISYAAIKVVKIPNNQSELKEMTGSGLSQEHIRSYYKKSIESLVDEIKMMGRFKSASHIVSIEDYEVLENDNGIGGTIYIRMELLKNIADYFNTNSIDKNEVMKMAIDILTALEFCHGENVVHRDIKPGNIFISEFGEFKLGDFGISREVEKTNATMSQKGTKSYMAPEMVKMGAKYGMNVDIYALGLTMYELLNHGRIPFLPAYPEVFFPNDREAAMIKRLLGEEFPDIEGLGELNAIIKKACHPNPQQRYQEASEMKEALSALYSPKKEIIDEEPSFIEKEKTSGDNGLFDEQLTIGMFDELPFEKKENKKENPSQQNEILDYIVNRFNAENKVDLRKDELACKRLEDILNKEMHNFNTNGKIVLDVPYLTIGPEGALHLNMTVEKHNIGGKSNHSSINGWLFDDDNQDKKENHHNNINGHVETKPSPVHHIITCPYCGGKAYLQFPHGYACVANHCGKWVNDGMNQSTFDEVTRLFSLYLSDANKTNYHEQLRLLNQIENLVGKNAQLYMRKGQVYGNLNDSKTQLDCYLKALDYDDQDALVYNGLCSCYIAKNNSAMAYQYGKKAYQQLKKGIVTRIKNQGVICSNYSIALELINRSQEAHNLLKEAHQYGYDKCDTLAIEWNVGSKYYNQVVNNCIKPGLVKDMKNIKFDTTSLNQARNVLEIHKNANVIFAVAGEKWFGRAYVFALSDHAIHFYSEKNWFASYYDFRGYKISCAQKTLTLTNRNGHNFVIDTGKSTQYLYQLLKTIQNKL